MKLTPHVARRYLLLAAFLVALPTLGTLYRGHSGKLLVATYEAEEKGIFYQSVVYIERHNLFIAYGHIINKPLTDKQVQQITDVNESDYPVYLGGPVAFPETKTYMIRNGQERPLFTDQPAEMDNKETARLMLGYAGWGPLQLNYEMGGDNWDVIDYDPVLVFETPPDQIWHKARQRLYRQKPPEDEKIL